MIMNNRIYSIKLKICLNKPTCDMLAKRKNLINNIMHMIFVFNLNSSRKFENLNFFFILRRKEKER